MAQVRLSSKTIRDSLIRTLAKLVKGLEWISQKDGEITLQVPEPYEHASIGPVDHRTCLLGTDECGDVGVLMGVISKTGTTPSRPRAKTKTKRSK